MRDSNMIPTVRLAHQNRFIKRNKYKIDKYKISPLKGEYTR